MKSPGASPERKKPKTERLPMEILSAEEREINPTDLLNYTTALSSFETPTEEQLVTIPGDAFRHHPNKDVDAYFRASSRWGVPAIAWNIVRPAFLWKVEFSITEFMNVEKKRKEEAAAVEAAANAPKSPKTPESEKSEKSSEAAFKEKIAVLNRVFPGSINLIKTVPVEFRTDESIEFVLDKAKSFDGFPFTWQRLCELLNDPTYHYNTLDKFLRAMEKVINVVTTINENGGRSFGDWEVPSNAPHHLESVFFGAVDEVEAMEMEEKHHHHQQQQQQQQQQHKKSGDYSSLSPEEQPLDMSQKSQTSMPAPFTPPTAPGAAARKEQPEPEPEQEPEQEKEDDEEINEEEMPEEPPSQEPEPQEQREQGESKEQ